jgi:hypothetical protein
MCERFRSETAWFRSWTSSLRATLEFTAAAPTIAESRMELNAPFIAA